MRFVVVLAALALLAGCGDDDETEAPAGTATSAQFAELTVTVDGRHRGERLRRRT